MRYLLIAVFVALFLVVTRRKPAVTLQAALDAILEEPLEIMETINGLSERGIGEFNIVAANAHISLFYKSTINPSMSRRETVHLDIAKRNSAITVAFVDSKVTRWIREEVAIYDSQIPPKEEMAAKRILEYLREFLEDPSVAS
jgi:hypothetical protein